VALPQVVEDARRIHLWASGSMSDTRLAKQFPWRQEGHRSEGQCPFWIGYSCQEKRSCHVDLFRLQLSPVKSIWYIYLLTEVLAVPVFNDPLASTEARLAYHYQ